MAELAKKLYIQASNGTQQTAKIYSTTGETNNSYICVNVGGTNGYVAIGETSNSQATKGRIQKTGGTAKAILASGVIPYTEAFYTSSGTFTVPSGITKLRVACCGSASSNQNYNNNATDSSITYNSTKYFVATHGTPAYSEHWGGSDGGTSYYSGTAGTPNGRLGVSTDGFARGFDSSVKGTYGAPGATVKKEYYDYSENNGGWKTDYYYSGSGGFNTGYLNVTSGAVITVTVGTPYSASGTVYGSAGFVLIGYGQGVQ